MPAPRGTKKEAREKAIEMLGVSRIPSPGPSGRRIPPPAFRRDAPEGDDRHGPFVQSQAAHRRRADDCSGCDDPGSDSRPLREFQEEMGMAIFLITHDLGVVAEIVERVIVMYTGKIVEEGPVVPLFQSRQHPYTRGLLASIPQIERGPPRLTAIPGVVPTLPHAKRLPVSPQVPIRKTHLRAARAAAPSRRRRAICRLLDAHRLSNLWRPCRGR